MTIKTYITTPIYYVNGRPHIGHAYTSLAADVLTRWHRGSDSTAVGDVFFCTGTDEHGQKVQKTAEANSVDVHEFCDKNSAAFKKLCVDLNITNDAFIRTTEERHKITVQNFWQKLEQNGWIYKGNYEGWYSMRDEAFYSEKEVVNGKAPSGAEVEWKQEQSYFFRLSEFKNILLQIYQSFDGFISPLSRLNEVKSFVEGSSGPLADLSISRSNFFWGVAVPDDEKHTIYVWLDALVNYITALGGFDNWCSVKNKIHIVGKDILRFHAVYWPAFLIGYNYKRGDVIDVKSIRHILPNKIFGHGWWTNKGEKISKSLGNVIDPYDIIAKYGLDKFRYFLFASTPFGNDGNFIEQDFINKTNADLVNNFGNLVQRTITMIEKNFPNETPDSFDILARNSDEYLAGYNLANDISVDMELLAFDKAIEKIIKYSTNANEFIDKSAPWRLLKNGNIQEAKEVLAVLRSAIIKIVKSIEPFIPESAAKALQIAISCKTEAILFERV